MKKLIPFAVLAAFVALPAIAQAQTVSASDGASVDARVVGALSVSADADLDFGDILQGTSSTVDKDNGDLAVFTIGGDNGASVLITWDASVTLEGPGYDLNNADTYMTLSAIDGWGNTDGTDLAGALTVGSGDSRSLDATTGGYTVWIGGTLSAGASQAPGAYSGTLNLTAEYN